jgi:hypothetical protein
LAELENDADAFIAAIHSGGMEGTHRLDVAERLIAANRPTEALAWLDKPRQRFEDDDSDGADTDLRVAALEAMGRKDEAQSVRCATSSGFSAPSIFGSISNACQISRISRLSRRRSRWLPATSRPNEPWRS